MFTDNPAVGRLLKFAGALCVVLTVYVAALALNALKENRFIGGGVPNTNIISVSGEGEVFAVPDIAEFGFSVVEEKATVKEAQDAAATKMNAILAFLKDNGVDEKDIKTTGYSANPRYEWQDTVRPMPAYEVGAGESSSAGAAEPAIYYDYPDNDTRVLVGYEVRQSISVKARDTEKVGELLAGVGEKGATDIYGPTFTIDDEEDLRREARAKAIEDAKEKAEELADDLGVDLVRIVSFSEGGWYAPMYMEKAVSFDAVGDAGGGVPEIPVGENSITANVTITYEIR